MFTLNLSSIVGSVNIIIHDVYLSGSVGIILWRKFIRTGIDQYKRISPNVLFYLLRRTIRYLHLMSMLEVSYSSKESWEDLKLRNEQP